MMLWIISSVSRKSTLFCWRNSTKQRFMQGWRAVLSPEQKGWNSFVAHLLIGGWFWVDHIRHYDAVLGRWLCVDPLQEKSLYVSTNFYITLKSATKPLNVLIAFTRPLITEFADNLNLKHPLLPTISPYPTMWLEAIGNNSPKGVSLSDLICIFAMSIVGFSCFFLQH